MVEDGRTPDGRLPVPVSHASLPDMFPRQEVPQGMDGFVQSMAGRIIELAQNPPAGMKVLRDQGTYQLIYPEAPGSQRQITATVNFDNDEADLAGVELLGFENEGEEESRVILFQITDTGGWEVVRKDVEGERVDERGRWRKPFDKGKIEEVAAAVREVLDPQSN